MLIFVFSDKKRNIEHMPYINGHIFVDCFNLQVVINICPTKRSPFYVLKDLLNENIKQDHTVYRERK